MTIPPTLGPFQSYHHEDAARHAAMSYEPEYTCPCHGTGRVTYLRLGYSLADDRTVSERCLNARETKP